MKQRPVLMSGELVRAILAGKKTQTRRPIKYKTGFAVNTMPNGEFVNVDKLCEEGFVIGVLECPYGKPGGILWIRETWQHTKCLNINHEDENYGYVYRADQQPWDNYEGWKWKPSIFMPKDAARLWLQIKDIRVERLHNISEEDAEAEGVQPVIQEDGDCYAMGFSDKWKEIYGNESYDSNSWIWVIEFDKIDKP